MNIAVQTPTSDISSVWLGAGGYEHFVCKYNEITNTFWFGNDLDLFTLQFDENPGYNPLPCGQPEVWNHYTKWGLPFYLGYEKKNYTSVQINDPLMALVSTMKLTSGWSLDSTRHAYLHS